MTVCRIAKHNDHLSNDFVQIDRLPLWRSSTVERAISVDDTGRTFRGINDSRQGMAGLFKLGRLASHPSQAWLRIYHHPGDPLLYLMSQPPRQFSPPSHP